MDFDFHKNDRFIPVYSNDIDKDACATYENYFGFVPECKNIKKMTNVPDCDVMIGGFPCQGFSIANMNKYGLKQQPCLKPVSSANSPVK